MYGETERYATWALGSYADAWVEKALVVEKEVDDWKKNVDYI